MAGEVKLESRQRKTEYCSGRTNTTEAKVFIGMKYTKPVKKRTAAATTDAATRDAAVERQNQAKRV
jgi:hypothetical protein